MMTTTGTGVLARIPPLFHGLWTVPQGEVSERTRQYTAAQTSLNFVHYMNPTIQRHEPIDDSTNRALLPADRPPTKPNESRLCRKQSQQSQLSAHDSTKRSPVRKQSPR